MAGMRARAVHAKWLETARGEVASSMLEVTCVYGNRVGIDVIPTEYRVVEFSRAVAICEQYSKRTAASCRRM